MNPNSKKERKKIMPTQDGRGYNPLMMSGDTAHMYGDNKNPAWYVPYYQEQLEKAMKVAADKFKHRTYMGTERIPTMNSTTITIQRADAIVGAGLSFDPTDPTASIESLTARDNNGAILDMNNAEQRNPVITQRTAYRMKLHLNGLWGQVNDVAEIVERYSTLKQLVNQLPYAMEETKDVYARNFMIMASSKDYAGEANSREQLVELAAGNNIDGTAAGSPEKVLANKKSSQLTLAQAVAAGMSLENNTILRPNTDLKDSTVDATREAYYNRTTAGLIAHPAPIEGFASDEGRYKLLLSKEAYQQLMNDPLFVNYWISNKTVSKPYGPEVNSTSWDDHGGWSTFFNIRMVKVFNSYRKTLTSKGVLKTSHTIDTAILLPQNTFAKVEISDNTGSNMYIYRFEGSNADVFKRAATVGLKWWDGIGVCTDQVPAITLMFAINVNVTPDKDPALKYYQENMGPFQKDDITKPMDPKVDKDPANP